MKMSTQKRSTYVKPLLSSKSRPVDFDGGMLHNNRASANLNALPSARNRDSKVNFLGAVEESLNGDMQSYLNDEDNMLNNLSDEDDDDDPLAKLVEKS